MNKSQLSLEPLCRDATQAFMVKVKQQFDVKGAMLFGSRARQTHHPESDADVAVLLRGQAGRFVATKLAMDDLAYEVLLDLGIRIQPLPIWESEWQNPQAYSNPQLLYNIARDGLEL
jgi:predicted nucleotidyltransferase